MNEHIIKLAEQSGFYYTAKTGIIASAGCSLEKFADQLIRECANQCFTPDGDRILRHFKMKEE